MTIECQGHVVSLSTGGTKVGDVQVTIQLEASRLLTPITIHARAGETDSYRPGTPLIVSIRPM